MLDDRARTLLKTLVERYIADGQPVGSRTLSRASGLELSPATIRNVMADLEELGLIASPHTSAGRVPTARGYRLFVDTMLTARPSGTADAAAGATHAQLRETVNEQLHPDQPQRVITHAAQVLSNLSHFVGVITAPRKTSVFHHIEFLRLGDRRVLVILVAPDGDVQNRVVFTARDHSQGELIEASNFINAHYSGLTIEAVRERLKTEVDALRDQHDELLIRQRALALTLDGTESQLAAGLTQRRKADEALRLRREQLTRARDAEAQERLRAEAEVARLHRAVAQARRRLRAAH